MGAEERAYWTGMGRGGEGYLVGFVLGGWNGDLGVLWYLMTCFLSFGTRDGGATARDRVGGGHLIRPDRGCEPWRSFSPVDGMGMDVTVLLRRGISESEHSTLEIFNLSLSLS